MNVDLRYFSGTGNSLYITRKIAKGLGDTKILPIEKMINHPPEEAAVIGFEHS